MQHNDLQPKPPETLKSIAAALWSDIIETHWPDKIKKTDLPLLEIYCANYQRWVEAEETLATQSHVLSSHTGSEYQNPYVGVSNHAMAIVTKLSKELGLTSVHAKTTKGKPNVSGIMARKRG